jgi:hypothetical protein
VSSVASEWGRIATQWPQNSVGVMLDVEISQGIQAFTTRSTAVTAEVLAI